MSHTALCWCAGGLVCRRGIWQLVPPDESVIVTSPAHSPSCLHYLWWWQTRHELRLTQSCVCNRLQAWAEDPLEALRLVAQLRDIRNGKGVTAAGQECLTWLQERHPLTLAANLEEVVRVSLALGLSSHLLQTAAQMCSAVQSGAAG